MKNYKIILLALSALGIASCTPSARIKGELQGAPEKQIIVKQLDVNVYKVLDTVKTGADGSFSYKMAVAKGQPEFVYLFCGDTRIASLLLESGETAVVSADTLGTACTVTGSEGSAMLMEVEKNFSAFLSDFYASADSRDMSRKYIDFYRESVKYVLGNSKSLTAIPVLYRSISADAPIFSQINDAVFFKTVCDSLKTVYPESRYVKALEKEATRREQMMALNNIVLSAQDNGYPDMSMNDINGKAVKLSEVDAKAILVHFWASSEDTQKIFNLDYLLPVYNEFRGKGFEIYAVGIDPDKANWASVVKSQKLPWINVNDGLGTASGSLRLYNVQDLPTSFLIVDGELYLEPINGVEGLRKELRKVLK